ncbi:pimeloyl-ACP methyl ester carboxylesterase [Dyadobacter jejuensis]|uniref:Pimeloyl-ACP methyl ester carboxylesterase n=1 Tax=Dyadobacter jejuensis TaxID=1082580 RepID=A0A316AJV4_9BACT|nr:alpha/beta hydrolase [Dyadobacter jejuensis]PWJ57140.1 pimeloyl-ACP methyl ester carboxylesterase [Dyadobacter jejuensis]
MNSSPGKKTSPRLWIRISLAGLLVSWLLVAQSCMRFRSNEKEVRTYFKEKQVPVESIHFTVQDQPLHYLKTGQEGLPTLFFVHGSPGSTDAFQSYLSDSSLLRRFRMIAIDRPGFGYSNFGKPQHLETQAHFIAQIIKKEANGAPIHLVGHSIGGPVIVQLAQNDPTLFASLTILAGSISPKDEPRELWRYPLAYFPLKYLLPGAFRPSNQEIVFFKKDLYQLDKGYDRLTMPVTFIHGDADNFVTVNNVAYGLSKLKHNPHVEKMIIHDADHFIPWKHKEVIVKHLLTL